MKVTYTLLMLIACIAMANAQYCGNSGTSICNPSGTLTEPGLSPSSQNLSPLVNNSASTTVLQFKNFDTFMYSGILITINSTKFDSIGNLPAGLCWSTNKSSNTFANQEDGCIKLSGTTCAAPGQYKLKLYLTIQTSIGQIGPMLDAESVNLRYFLRVKNNGDADVVVDTNQTALFVPYGNSANCGTPNISVSLGSNQFVCNGHQATLNPVISNGQSPYSYSWSSTGNSLSCNNCANPTATITQISTYQVTVTDATSATASASVSYVLLGGGTPYQITASGPTTFCQGGTVTLNAGSGFTSYAWSNSAQTQSITVSQGGTYSVTVTSSSGCTSTDSEVVTVNSPTISNYQITANGPTTICGGGSVTLNAGTGFTGYNWSNGQQTQTITVSQTGTYSVTAVGQDGCTYNDSENVNTNAAFSGQQICIVTVNPATGKNLIVWEKGIGIALDSFKVYRETNITGQYQLIRKQAAGNFSTYEDALSNPAQKSERYVITTVDACGESGYSAPHRTIHLTSNVGINNEVNLIWNQYEGFAPPSFNIYRGSTQGNMQLLATVASGNLSYTDLTPPSPPLFYQVECVNPNGCVPTAKTDNYSSTLSNIINVQATGIQQAGNQPAVRIQPNPANNVIYVSSPAPITEVVLFTIDGKEVMKISEASINGIDVSALDKGIYLAQVKTTAGNAISKWVKM